MMSQPPSQTAVRPDAGVVNSVLSQTFVYSQLSQAEAVA
jgi:hypothetical protein